MRPEADEGSKQSRTGEAGCRLREVVHQKHTALSRLPDMKKGILEWATLFPLRLVRQRTEREIRILLGIREAADLRDFIVRLFLFPGPGSAAEDEEAGPRSNPANDESPDVLRQELPVLAGDPLAPSSDDVDFVIAGQLLLDVDDRSAFEGVRVASVRALAPFDDGGVFVVQQVRSLAQFNDVALAILVADEKDFQFRTGPGPGEFPCRRLEIVKQAEEVIKRPVR